MGDIISRIKLETVGAEQASREIRKLKDAFDATSSASKGIGMSGGGGDPFSQAIQPPAQYGGAPILDSHSKYHREWLQQQRQSSRAVGAPGWANTASTMTQQMANDNSFGAMGTGMSGLAGVAGPVGIGLAVGAVAIKAIGSLAQGEKERINQLFGSGISQRLGNYESTEAVSLAMARNGVPTELITPYLSALSSSGGKLNKLTTNNINRGAEAVTSLGLSPDVVAGLLGTTQMLGMSQGTMGNMFYQQGQGTFGRFGAQGMNAYMGASKAYLDEQGAMGVKAIDIKSDAFNANNDRMMGAVDYTGLTAQGAINLNQRSNTRARATSNLSTGEDVMALQAMMAGDPNLSMTDALMKMEQDPGAVNTAMFKYINQTGGSQDEKMMMARRYLGGTMTEASNWLNLEGAIADPDRDALTASADSEVFGKGGVARKIKTADQQKMFAGAEGLFAEAIADMKLAFSNFDMTGVKFDARRAEIDADKVTIIIPEGTDLKNSDTLKFQETTEALMEQTTGTNQYSDYYNSGIRGSQILTKAKQHAYSQFSGNKDAQSELLGAMMKMPAFSSSMDAGMWNDESKIVEALNALLQLTRDISEDYVIGDDQ